MTSQRSMNDGPVGEPEPLNPLPFPLERREVPVRPCLCIVIPVFNEAAVLERTSAKLIETLDTIQLDWTVLFVNDGSRDESARLMERLHERDPRLGYLLLSRNFGQQAAISAGLEYAKGDIVITMDADLQHPPHMLKALVDAWRQGFDVVHTRKLRTSGLSTWRGVQTRLAYALIRRVAGIRIIPQASDFRLVDAAALRALRHLPETRRLHRGLTVWIGFRQCVLPFEAPARAAGQSQYSFRQLVTLFARSVLDFSDTFLYLGLVVGGLALGLSGLLLMVMAVITIGGWNVPPAWMWSIAVTLFMNSVVLLFVGILGIYIARIYGEARRRPAYIVRLARTGRPGLPERRRD